MEYRKKNRKLNRSAAAFLITLTIFLVTLVPFSSLFAFDPDYPDFIWTYNMDEGKIISGRQKALYLTGYSMASEEKMQDIYRMIEETELNSLVFNVKEDSGEISYDCQVDFFIETGSVRQVYDLEKALKDMDERGIYSIARIVLFKDGVITKARPDLAVQNKNTGSRIYLDGGYWLDLYNQEMWGHYVDLVLELVEMGIDEIQFDYIRAPSRGNFSLARFPANDMDREKVWAVTGFLNEVKKAVKNYPVKISADVFGFVFIAENDQGIGQLIEEMAPYLDYIYPMPYPSHYSSGFMGFSNPEAHPYEVVKHTLDKGIKRIGDTDCMILPWIQAFGLGIRYSETEILAQVRAAEDLGIEGFLFWNAGNKYSTVERALKSR
jgi:hypothetical protein